MARPINAKGMIKDLTGMGNLPSGPDQGAQLAAGPDNVPAVIHDAQGNPKGPAMIKEGEIVFSVPSVIGAGGGNYQKGAKILLEFHKRLQREGEKYLSKQGLNASQ